MQDVQVKNHSLRADNSQWAHDVKMTSYQRRYDVIDVMTSHRCRPDVILTSCACWVMMFDDLCYIVVLVERIIILQRHHEHVLCVQSRIL